MTASKILISVVVPAHNEANNLAKTISSVGHSCPMDTEIIILDDASTDRCCNNQSDNRAHVKRLRKRTGVAYCRDLGVELASGEFYAFVDGHQRFSKGCLEQCAQLAGKRDAIVCPDIRGFERNAPALYGAIFRRRLKGPPFGADWNLQPPPKTVRRINSLRAPAYVIPRTVYPSVRWSRLLRGWGGSEACVSIKAFFTRTPILHLSGPIAYHKFKKKFHYEVTWDEIWRNHALIARICFSEATWYDYWLPEVFREHLSEKTQLEMDSDAVRAEHLEFQQIKVRPDHEFWTRLAFQKVPPAVKR
ncbi:MAG: glycosyltransferase family 2 protein [Planctomycetaceae bacterium]